MKGKLNIYYDDDGDFLEIHIGEFTKGYFKNVGDGVFQRIDENTGKITGIAIMSFKKRTAGPKDLEVTIPLQMELSP